MRQTSFADMSCSLARSLEVMGDWWSPLILRDIHLGINRFDELVTDLGIARALLTTRLDAMVEGNLLERVVYQVRPVRFEYRLTASGKDLVPVLIALTAWGDRWRSPDGAPVVTTHHCGSAAGPAIVCAACGESMTDENVSFTTGPGGRRAPGTMLVPDLLRNGSAR
jgi:DNA-binding HxlR family transcriptional regulator